MGIFKKEVKEAGLPDLPGSLPELPELPPEYKSKEINLPELPTMPKTAMGDSMNLQVIKSSVISNEKPIAIEIKNIGNSEEPKEAREFQSSEETAKSQIFVKIDRFKDALKKFEEVKKIFNDIEYSVSRIMETKEKEEAELKLWKEKTEGLKEKIKVIDTYLFNKLSSA
jgi:hypothetical protein